MIELLDIVYIVCKLLVWMTVRITWANASRGHSTAYLSRVGMRFCPETRCGKDTVYGDILWSLCQCSALFRMID